MNYANFFELKGKTITSIDGSNSDDSDTIITTSDGSIYTLTHIQDCCENVRVYGTVGNIDDVLNEEVIDVEDTNPMDNPNAPDYKYYESATWSQFRIVTNKGTFEMWWLGESNGYYSETVSVIKNS
ncbi:MAG: hypothetical protein EB127_18705 [Alphaproteobacteria bacterium]|nr:hypothetical protein [Alphaproteobacteria bacterium]